MSVIDHERVFDNLTAVLEFFGEQLLKDIYTVMPGIVEQFDPVTRRVKVRGSLSIVFPDGTEMLRPPIVNVPVVWPFGGGYHLYFPLEEGDAVLLAYSMRGITEFKRSFADAKPTMSSLLDERDAVAIAGFGSLEITPVNDGGASFQDRDGDNYVSIDGDNVKVKSAGSLDIEADDTVTLKGSTIHFDGNVTGIPGLP